jgi:hypothetical protein
MNRDEIVELAAGYALGTLEVEDRARFEALLAMGDAEARAALRDFESTVVRSRGPLTQVPSPARPVPARRSLVTVVTVGVMAAGIVAIAIGLAVSTVYDRRISQLAQEQALLTQEFARQESLMTILQDPVTRIIALSGLAPAPEAKGRMLWHATAGGLLVAQGLPPAPEGKTYQLWAIAGTRAPVPAGVFAVDARGVGTLRVVPLQTGDGLDAFAVTLEPAGGVAAPTGGMYLVGRL